MDGIGILKGVVSERKVLVVRFDRVKGVETGNKDDYYEVVDDVAVCARLASDTESSRRNGR